VGRVVGGSLSAVPDPEPDPVASDGLMPRLTREETAHVARLARIELSDEELDRYAGQLAAVLDHAAAVAAVDAGGRVPTAHPLALANVLRPDVPRPSLDRDEVLAQAPVAEGGRFRVPRILGEAP
jgi:aspartyl-tRNA(Asn)/glutamyl-tRNA(Gln) amidotransferase subunit C